MSIVGTARGMHTEECVTRTEYKFTLYDMVAILNVCSTRSTKASIIMLSDSCDVLRTYIYILSYSMRERIEIYPHTYWLQYTTQSQFWTCAVPEAHRRPSRWVITAISYWLQDTTVSILNVCSTRSTKASIITLSDTCDVLRIYTELEFARANRKKSLILVTVYNTVAILNVCSTRSTKVSIIVMRDKCGVLRRYTELQCKIATAAQHRYFVWANTLYTQLQHHSPTWGI